MILERGVVTLKDIEDYCHRVHYKTSNAERRLRELRGFVEPVYNDRKTAIIAYKSGDTAPIINKAGLPKASLNLPPDLDFNGRPVTWIK